MGINIMAWLKPETPGATERQHKKISKGMLDQA